MLRRVLHWFIAKPRIYDFVQRLVGARTVNRRLDALIAADPAAGIVLDLGGGTGINREFWPPASTYVCLDLDPVKLRGFRDKYPYDIPVLGDATRVPIETGSMDVVLCAKVSHHIPDDALESLVTESIRALKIEGRFIFFDAVWAPSWPTGRLLWQYDRGSYPRHTDVLKTLIARHCTIAQWQEFTIFHKYILCMGIKAEDHACARWGESSDD